MTAKKTSKPKAKKHTVKSEKAKPVVKESLPTDHHDVCLRSPTLLEHIKRHARLIKRTAVDFYAGIKG